MKTCEMLFKRPVSLQSLLGRKLGRMSSRRESFRSCRSNEYLPPVINIVCCFILLEGAMLHFFFCSPDVIALQRGKKEKNIQGKTINLRKLKKAIITEINHVPQETLEAQDGGCISKCVEVQKCIESNGRHMQDVIFKI